MTLNFFQPEAISYFLDTFWPDFFGMLPTRRPSMLNEALTTPPSTPNSASSNSSPAVPKSALNTLTPPTSPIQIQSSSSLSQLPVTPNSEDRRCPSAVCDDGLEGGNSSGIERHRELQTDEGVRICPFKVDLLQDSQGQGQVFGYGAWSVVLKGNTGTDAALKSSHPSGTLTPPLSPTNSIPLVVAVKRPARIDAIPILENEAKILTYLSHIQDHSKHVVTFYGVVVPEQKDLVLEALPFSLEEHIKRCAVVAKRTLTTWNMSEPVVGSSGLWLSLAEALISGLLWLHEVAGVVHGDIKPGNLVLRRIQPEEEDNDEDISSFAFQPLFIDFSSSHRLDANAPPLLNTLSAVTREYTAPELLVSSVLRDPKATATKQSDVFSLAVTLLAAATGNTMVYSGSVFQRQAMATRGWQVLDFARSGGGGSIEDGGARVPRHGVVDRALDRAVLKADHDHALGARISAPQWLQHVQQMRRGEQTKKMNL